LVNNQRILATASWGVATAAVGFLRSWILAATHRHLPLFTAGLAAALMALLIASLPGPRMRST